VTALDGRRGVNLPQIHSALRRLPPDVRPTIVIVVAVLLANALYLLGIVEANPLGPRSGLAASIVPGRLAGQPTIDPNAGFISQAVGHRAALDVLHGHLPWWDPYEGLGAPLAGGCRRRPSFR
jgi:hypothetical protein